MAKASEAGEAGEAGEVNSTKDGGVRTPPPPADGGTSTERAILFKKKFS